ncbi:MAG TPA: glycosyltransferase family 9 protein [Bryobacteraceae bacterium]
MAWHLGEKEPGGFFRVIVEGLADSFDPIQAAAYEELMRPWIPEGTVRIKPVLPDFVDNVCVLSRVTLGADIKITSIILDAMKKRFPYARIAFVGSRKSAELFAADERISHIEVEYPRSGPVSQRIEFAAKLREQLKNKNRIVVDPDSRITQLGMVPVCEARFHLHFPSRVAKGAENLTDLTKGWLNDTFGETGEAYIAPERVPIEGDAPRAAVSFGVGENDAKRIGGDFEAQVIRTLGERFPTIWIDRGVGGEEAQRVTAAAEASGCSDRIRFWEGSFAGFASLISQCDLYVGYDSAGQHAAAAAGVPLVSFFAGAPSERFRQRWAPAGPGKIQVIDADSFDPAACLDAIRNVAV